MRILVLLITVPVFCSVAAAGFVAVRFGSAWIWGVLALGLVVSTTIFALLVGAGTPRSYIGRFAGPIVFYLPCLALAGIALRLIGEASWTPLVIGVVSVIAAASNIVLAPLFFFLGGEAALWESGL
jgi:hypothetical protein